MKKTRRKKKKKRRRSRREKRRKTRNLRQLLSKQLLGRNSSSSAPEVCHSGEHRGIIPKAASLDFAKCRCEFGVRLTVTKSQLSAMPILQKTALRYDVPRDFDLLTIDTDYNDYWTKANLVGFTLRSSVA